MMREEELIKLDSLIMKSNAKIFAGIVRERWLRNLRNEAYVCLGSVQKLREVFFVSKKSRGVSSFDPFHSPTPKSNNSKTSFLNDPFD